MRKIVLAMSTIMVLASCSAPEQQSSVPMDLKAVEAYQQKVASAGHTVENQSVQPQWELNQSDKRPKAQIIRVYSQPSVYYGYGWGHRHYSGVGMRLGY